VNVKVDLNPTFDGMDPIDVYRRMEIASDRDICVMVDTLQSSSINNRSTESRTEVNTKQDRESESEFNVRRNK